MKRLVIGLLCLAALAACSDDDTTSPPPPPPPAGGGPLQAPGETFWWNDTVFYQVFVRSFYDTDGDGIGDLQGLIAKLDYLNDGDPTTDADLGVTGLWLMPVTESPSYHGYDVTDYRTIEPDYGTNADFDQLVAEAHNRGIVVIIDLVMNDTSNQIDWFTDAVSGSSAPYRDWYRWSPTHPGYTGPWGQPVWHNSASGYYYGVFWSGMPDLNYEEPAVKTEMWDIARFWLQDMVVDGFRLDAVKYIIEEGSSLENTASTFAFWREFEQHYKSLAPQALTVGEAWDSSNVVVQYVNNGFDTCFEFELAERTLTSVNSSSAGTLAAKAQAVVDLYPYHQYATFLTNHDQDRAYNRLARDDGRMKLAAAVYLTLPGVPFVYYGEEIAMIGTGAHENIRTPMQWTDGPSAGFTTGTPWYSINTNYATYNVAVMTDDANSLLSWYRDLIAIRNASTALRRGTYQELGTSSGNLYPTLRVAEDDTVVVIHNFSASVVASYTLSVTTSQLAPGVYSAASLIDGATVAELTVTTDGAIASWSPTSSLASRGTQVLRLASP